MKLIRIVLMIIVSMTMSADALDNVEVTEVKARQRYPWNGLVDIDFKLDSIPTEPYRMKVEAYDNVGKTTLTVKSAWAEGVSQKDNPCMVRGDTRRILWDAAADLPNGFKCTNVLVTCRDERLENDPKRYMIIDLSAGSSAVSYPISYTNCPPIGGWKEEHKLTKLVLRRIGPCTFQMGSLLADGERGSNESYHTVNITKSYYMGVYEITARQYALVMGGSANDTQPVTKDWATIRGRDTELTATCGVSNYTVGSVPYYLYTCTQNKQISSYSWPTKSTVDPNSFIGKLRARTGTKLDLPTEAQWECACKGGCVSPLYVGTENSSVNAATIKGSAVLNPQGDHLVYVGNYLPNAYGLYDMTGNVDEWCLDVYKPNLGTSDVKDPQGASETYETVTILNPVSPSGNLLNFVGGTIKIECAGKQIYSSTTIHDRTMCKYNAVGIRRVVRGAGTRTSARSSALNIHYSNPVIKMKFSASGVYDSTYEYNGSYTNPTHGIRLALTID